MPKYIKLAETKSTNTYLKRMAALLPSGTVIYTYRQTAGRGQKGNSWESEDGKNLTFSMLLKHPGIEAKRQFYMSEAVSLAVAEMLSHYTEDISIKWPNDVYWADCKMCGMLIENSLDADGGIEYSIPGVGININQERFLSDAPNPVSLKNVTDRDYDLEALLHEVCERIEAECSMLAHATQAQLDALHRRYLDRLYRNDGQLHTWELPDGSRFQASIAGVAPDGMFTLQRPDGTQASYAFKQVKHVVGQATL